MAITKILYIGDCGTSYHGKHLKQSIDYILKDAKTGGGRWVSAVNCQPGYAYEQMMGTKELFHKTDKRQGYHIIISFEEGEVTPDQAFRIVGEFVDEYLGKGYEAVYVIHDNTAHVHGHIVLNSVSFVTGKKYRYEKGDWAKYIQPITNRLCTKYGLSTITIENDEAMAHDSYDEWKERRDGRFVWSDMIRRDLDACIVMAKDYEEFLSLLSDKGYEIKQNKHLAVKPPGMSRYRRCRYFGEDYTGERIRERIQREDMVSYNRSKVPAKIVRVNVPYHIRRAKLSGIQKRYFARLYRLGKIKQRPYSQAWKYRDEIRKMHRLHEDYMFLSDHEVHSGSDLGKIFSELGDKKKAVEKKRREFFRERRRYRPLWDKLEELKKLSYAQKAYEDGDLFFKEEHEAYGKLLLQIREEGYSKEELEQLQEHYKIRADEIRREYEQVGKDYRTAERLLDEQASAVKTHDRREERLEEDLRQLR